MVELADIFRDYGPAYREQYGPRMLPSHLAAMRAIEQCRTEVLGGHLYYCAHCDESWYSYHSCRNRHCPKCQQDAAQQWLERQQELLLPVPYFMVTFTLPQPLRSLARTEQKMVYNLLFRTAAESLQQLAQDPRFVGGQIGMVGILQTWTRDLATILTFTFSSLAAPSRPMVCAGCGPRITSSSTSNRWPSSFAARCATACAKRVFSPRRLTRSGDRHGSWIVAP